MLKNFSKKDFTATNILIIITVLMYIIQINIPKGSLLFGLNLYFLVYDFWWQPLSSMFSHGGLAHLGMNMFVFWKFNREIQRCKRVSSFIFNKRIINFSFIICLYFLFRQSSKFSWSIRCYLCLAWICGIL